MISDYLEAVASIINEALEQTDLSDDARSSILSDTVYNFAMLHDQGDITFGRRQYEPIICFQSDGQIVMDADFAGMHELSHNAANAESELANAKKTPGFWRKKR